jgi:hypothetical protein
LRLLAKNAATLPGQLQLPLAQQMAVPRRHALQAFLAAAQAEGCLTE